jgi:hypothetical protein
MRQSIPYATCGFLLLSTVIHTLPAVTSVPFDSLMLLFGRFSVTEDAFHIHGIFTSALLTIGAQPFGFHLYTALLISVISIPLERHIGTKRLLAVFVFACLGSFLLTQYTALKFYAQGIENARQIGMLIPDLKTLTNPEIESMSLEQQSILSDIHAVNELTFGFIGFFAGLLAYYFSYFLLDVRKLLQNVLIGLLFVESSSHIGHMDLFDAEDYDCIGGGLAGLACAFPVWSERIRNLVRRFQANQPTLALQEAQASTGPI